MKSFVFAFVLILCSIKAYSQYYLISFSASGEHGIVDSVKVTNLTQCTRITMAGTDTLLLFGTVGTDHLNLSTKPVSIFPNPVQGESHIVFYAENRGEALISITGISGNAMIQQSHFLARGFNRFNTGGLNPGVYVVSIIDEKQVYSGKITSTGAGSAMPYLRQVSSHPAHIDHPELKSGRAIVQMQYNHGERLLIKGFGNNHARIITLVPTESQHIDFEFLECVDADGNHYPIVTIGNQTWMAENLKTTHYLDGTVIPSGLDDGAWANASYGAFSIYPHSMIPGLDSDEEVMEAYGILYNWYAVDDSRNICPEGWYTPSHAEWTQLENYLMAEYYLTNHPDDLNGLGNALKSFRQVNSPLGEDCATNEHPRWNAHSLHFGSDLVGFGTLPAGRRRLNGVYFDIGNYGLFWTSSSHTATHAINRTIFSNQGNIAGFFSQNYRKTIGFSVRCIKE